MNRWIPYCAGLVLSVGLAGCDLWEQPPNPDALLALEEERIIGCRARLDNFLMRFEELAKPKKERWESFHEYMGKGCVR